MNFCFHHSVRSANPGCVIEEWQKVIEATCPIEAIFLARELKNRWYTDQKSTDKLVISMTLSHENNEKPFWYSERGKFKRQSTNT